MTQAFEGGTIRDAASIADALLAIAARSPDAAALYAPARTTGTFGDLAAQIAYVRDTLAAWNIAPGDVVTGVAGAREEMAGLCATLCAQSTFAPLSAHLSVEHYSDLLDRLRPHAVFVPDRADHALAGAARARGLRIVRVVPDAALPVGRYRLELVDRAAANVPPPRSLAGLAYLLVTSGTTGRPKLVPGHHRQQVMRAQIMARWLDYSPSDRTVHIVPMHMGHGLRASLMDVLLSGASVVCLPEGDVTAFVQGLEQFRPTCLSAGFTVYRQLLARGPELASQLRAYLLRFARAGSGRLEPEEVDALEQLFEAPLLVSYSSTETCAISHDPLPPAQRRRGAAGLPVACELRVLDAANRIVEDGSAGELVVRGPLVCSGYVDDAELTARSFVDGWFRTGDAGRIDGDGYVYITGRIKELINRGGEKISPREIDRVLETVPGVEEAATFGVPHATLGEEIVAAIVRASGADLDEASVLAHARARLGPSRVPRAIHFVDQLPRTETGKLSRAALAARAWHDGRHDAPTQLPASALEAELAALWMPFVRNTQLRREDDFFLAGGDSLGGARLLMRVRATYGVTLKMSSLFGEAATIAGMARVIEARRAAPDDRQGIAREAPPIRRRPPSAT
jgi:acyl-CoA synthetase (AMP-forming)/AMP-acid ligase II